ncbi:MAG: LamG domain-containing protein [Lentisphaerae bacterium]|nr:LamG domain-containing protein [Lentisphaerota bacterium]MCP4100624.1 LamG domain-containing protein [Lentisphaerota bacterium]
MRKEIFRTTLIVMLLSAFTNLINADDIKGLWNLDEKSVSEKAKDDSGNNLHGKYSAAAIPGKKGRSDYDKAVKFNGKSYINLKTPEELTGLTDKFTVEAWIKPDTVKGSQRVISCSSPDGFGFGIKDGELIFTFFRVFDHISSGAKIEPRKWCHIAAVIDTANPVNVVTFYKNGILLKRVTHVDHTPGKKSTKPLCIGAASDGSEGFHGLIDEVVIFGKPLSQKEIAKHLK